MAEATGLRNAALPYPVYGAPYGIAFCILDADGDGVTSAAGLDSEVSLNGDTFADCTNESTEIGNGMYYLLLTAAETTADVVAIAVKTSTSGAKTTFLTLYPRKLVELRSGTSQAPDNAADKGYIKLDSSASAINDFYNGCLVVATIDSVVEARIIDDYDGTSKNASVTPDFNTATDNDDTFKIYLPEGVQIPTANATHIGGTAQTGRDIGASVLLSSGTGTGQISLSSGAVILQADQAVNVTKINGTSIAGTSTQVAAAFVKFFNVASPTGTVNSLPDAVAGASGGVSIVGSAMTLAADQAVNVTKWGGTAIASAYVQANTAQWGGSTLPTAFAVSDKTGFSLANDSITAGTFDESTAFPLKAADTGATAVARTGADSDTLKTLSDQVDAAALEATLTAIKGATWSASTDTLEAIRDRGDSAWITATGFSTLSAADVRTAIGLATANLDSQLSAISGYVDCLPASWVTVSTAAQVADAVWDEALSGHLTSGTTGAALNGASAAGDPWSTALPGAYGAGTAGYILGTNLNATVSSRSSHAAADVVTALGTGTTLTAIPWNAAWDAEVQSECTDALNAYDPPTNTEMEARTLVAANYATSANQTTILGYVDCLPASWVTVPTAAHVADAVWDEALSGHLTSGTTGAALNGASSSADPWSTALPGAYGAGTAGYILGTNLNATVSSRSSHAAADVVTALGTGTTLTAIPWNAAWDAEVQSECTDALNAYDPPTNTEMEARTLVAANYATSANQTTILGYVDCLPASWVTVPTAADIKTAMEAAGSHLALILDDTGTAGVVVASGSKAGYSLASAGLDAIVVETGMNARQAISVIASAVAGILSGAATSTITIKAAQEGTTTRIVAACDTDGNRSSVTLTLPT